MKFYNGYGTKIEIGTNTSNFDFSSLQGKKCLAIGDSYTNALASSGGALYNFNQSLGIETLNYGINGATLRDKSEKGYASYPMVCRVCHTISKGDVGVGTQVPWDISNVGYIWLMGGTNDDFIYPYTTGTDVCDSDQTHLYGAINLILQTLVAKYPNVPIIIGLEPCNYASYDSFTESVDKTTDYSVIHKTDVSLLNREVLSSHLQQEKQRIIREVAELYAQSFDNVKIVDLCFNWYTPLNETHKSNYWSNDKLHLSSVGYEQVVKGTKFDSIEKALKEVFATE